MELQTEIGEWKDPVLIAMSASGNNTVIFLRCSHVITWEREKNKTKKCVPLGNLQAYQKCGHVSQGNVRPLCNV